MCSGIFLWEMDFPLIGQESNHLASTYLSPCLINLFLPLRTRDKKSPNRETKENQLSSDSAGIRRKLVLISVNIKRIFDFSSHSPPPHSSPKSTSFMGRCTTPHTPVAGTQLNPYPTLVFSPIIPHNTCDWPSPSHQKPKWLLYYWKCPVMSWWLKKKWKKWKKCLICQESMFTESKFNIYGTSATISPQLQHSSV